MTTRVSIVLPTRDGSRYLPAAVESVLSQSFRDWELILVDDGSTDDTPRIVAGLAARDGRIRPFWNDRPRRLPGALNRGFAEARGEYLGWTSDDNLYLPDALGEMASFLDGNPGTDVVYADYARIDGSGARTGATRVGEAGEIFYGNCVGPCFLFRRRVLEALSGYSEKLFLAEDFDFWLRASARFTLTPLHRELYLYREHDASLSSRELPKVIRATERALRSFFDAHPETGPEIRGKSWLILSRRAMAEGRILLADKYLIRAALCGPGRALRGAERIALRQERLRGAEASLSLAEAELRDLRGSWSWRITAPLRRLRRLWGFGGGGAGGNREKGMTP